ncbi:MAG: YaaR family protein [Spirochaetia bacterium]|jgi:uncharacterized protein YaaR (DUF327 family)|nr:YaaR family protein [Spirochaetia bacterium]
MIKIYPSSGKPNDDSKKVKGKTSLSLSQIGSDFKAMLESAIAPPQASEGINDLLDELHDQEKRFADSMSFYEMNRYRSLVQKILKKINHESLNLKEYKIRHGGKDKIDTIIETVDQKLLELSSAITKGSPAFALMKTMEEIRGLIIDLLK